MSVYGNDFTIPTEVAHNIWRQFAFETGRISVEKSIKNVYCTQYNNKIRIFRCKRLHKSGLNVFTFFDIGETWQLSGTYRIHCRKIIRTIGVYLSDL